MNKLGNLLTTSLLSSTEKVTDVACLSLSEQAHCAEDSEDSGDSSKGDNSEEK